MQTRSVFRYVHGWNFVGIRSKHALATISHGRTASKANNAVHPASKRKSKTADKKIETIISTKVDEFYQWASIKDIRTKVSLLIKEANFALDSRFLFPRQRNIVPSCVSFWTKNFPNQRLSADDRSDKNMSSSNLNSSSCFATLSQVLSSIYGTNSKLTALSDISVAAGEFGQFLRLCHRLRREAKTHKGLNSGTLLVEPVIYEILARHFANKADWPNLSGLLSRLEQDGLPASKKLYLYGLECIGRLLRNATLVNLSPSLTPYSPAIATTLAKVVVQKSSSQKELEQRIIEVLHNLVKKAEAEGHDLTTGLMELPRTEGTLQHILLALERAHPGVQPSLFYLPEAMTDRQANPSVFITTLSERSYSVERHINTVPHAMRNSFAGVFPSTADLLRAFEDQLALEKQGEVRITPVLPPFPIAADQQKRPPISPKLRVDLFKSLMVEQERWRSMLMIGFKELLYRLRSTHSRDEITVYPFLKILPASHYVDLMIKAIDNVVLDSALQHVSSYRVCLQLGQCVEAACNLFRREKLGVLDELKHVYRDYGTMFNEERMALPHFRHMWLHALDKSVLRGVSLDQGWPEWTSSVHFLVGRTLYSLIYDRVRFDRNEPTRVRHGGSTQPPPQQYSSLHSTRVAIGPVSQETTMKRPEEAPVLFEVCAEYPHEMRNEVKIHPTLANWYRDAQYPPLSFNPAELPMLCPPIPWTNMKDAGYLISRNYATRLMRHSHASPVTNPVLNDDLDFDPKRIPAVFDALNCLAACPWRVNEAILDSLIDVARSGGNRKLKVPERVVHASSDSLCISKTMNYEERRQARRASREAQRYYDEARSLWATELYRLSIANQYRGRVFWFPHSMDFRGRVYPCPPHFHHMGCDIARSLIVFAKGLPLGPKGLDWLKIHLINLTGLKKRCPNSERLELANSIIDDILDSALNPFEGRRWWQAQEEPWQTLACCREIAAAMQHESGPESFVSHFPVHQDGSCNGLQHYAALGRDRRGAESVNLTDKECPQDVYGDVVEVVEEQRRKDAAAGLPVAQILEGFVRRKVIKQSVMTTVYGVTLYGASEQISKQLRDLEDFPSREWIRPAAAYLARLTLNSISRIFTSSSEIQAWFGQLAHHISGNIGCRVSWETPLGLPVTQPYMRFPKSSSFSEYAPTDLPLAFSPFSPPPPEDASLPEVLSVGSDALMRSNGSNQRRVAYKELPIPNSVKQKNAFPPNFIHSLDSCHMMLTALHCLKVGITFASVHDCFWTHAATVDEMNKICREEFIALHSEPILENFAEYLRSKFAYSSSEIANMTSETKRAKAMAFNELLRRVPKPGTFDLNEVRKSTYFFS